jgi:hypothetical protein
MVETCIDMVLRTLDHHVGSNAQPLDPPLPALLAVWLAWFRGGGSLWPFTLPPVPDPS